MERYEIFVKKTSIAIALVVIFAVVFITGILLIFNAQSIGIVSGQDAINSASQDYRNGISDNGLYVLIALTSFEYFLLGFLLSLLSGVGLVSIAIIQLLPGKRRQLYLRRRALKESDEQIEDYLR